MRVVASIEVLNSWGLMAVYMHVALRSLRRELEPLRNQANLPPKTSTRFSRALSNWQWVVPTPHLSSKEGKLLFLFVY